MDTGTFNKLDFCNAFLSVFRRIQPSAIEMSSSSYKQSVDWTNREKMLNNRDLSNYGKISIISIVLFLCCISDHGAVCGKYKKSYFNYFHWWWNRRPRVIVQVIFSYIQIRFKSLFVLAVCMTWLRLKKQAIFFFFFGCFWRLENILWTPTPPLSFHSIRTHTGVKKDWPTLIILE